MPRRRGFTFLELLVVMALIGSLSAIAVPRFRHFKERSYVAVMTSDLDAVRTAQEAFWAENLRYSLDTVALEFHPTSGVHLTLSTTDLVRGYTAIATHGNAPGLQCATRTGPDATSAPSGSIVCGAAAAPSGGLASPVP